MLRNQRRPVYLGVRQDRVYLTPARKVRQGQNMPIPQATKPQRGFKCEFLCFRVWGGKIIIFFKSYSDCYMQNQISI